MKSIQSCLDYIISSQNSGLWRLMDEYGRTVPIDKFEEWVRKSMDGITISDYYLKHPEREDWESLVLKKKLPRMVQGGWMMISSEITSRTKNITTMAKENLIDKLHEARN